MSSFNEIIRDAANFYLTNNGETSKVTVNEAVNEAVKKYLSLHSVPVSSDTNSNIILACCTYLGTSVDIDFNDVVQRSLKAYLTANGVTNFTNSINDLLVQSGLFYILNGATSSATAGQPVGLLLLMTKAS